MSTRTRRKSRGSCSSSLLSTSQYVNSQSHTAVISMFTYLELNLSLFTNRRPSQHVANNADYTDDVKYINLIKTTNVHVFHARLQRHTWTLIMQLGPPQNIFSNRSKTGYSPSRTGTTILFDDGHLGLHFKTSIHRHQTPPRSRT